MDSRGDGWVSGFPRPASSRRPAGASGVAASRRGSLDSRRGGSVGVGSGLLCVTGEGVGVAAAPDPAGAIRTGWAEGSGWMMISWPGGNEPPGGLVEGVGAGGASAAAGDGGGKAVCGAVTAFAAPPACRQ